LNKSIESIIESGTNHKEYSPKEIEAFRLYYVACSRATKVLENAVWLE